MYLLKNKTGNAYRHAESKVKRDRLVAEGWEDVTQEQTTVPVEEETTEPEQTTPPSEGDAEAEVNPEPERKGRPGRNTQAAKKADKE